MICPRCFHTSAAVSQLVLGYARYGERVYEERQFPQLKWFLCGLPLLCMFGRYAVGAVFALAVIDCLRAPVRLRVFQGGVARFEGKHCTAEIAFADIIAVEERKVEVDFIGTRGVELSFVRGSKMANVARTAYEQDRARARRHAS